MKCNLEIRSEDMRSLLFLASKAIRWRENVSSVLSNAIRACSAGVCGFGALYEVAVLSLLFLEPAHGRNRSRVHPPAVRIEIKIAAVFF